MHNGWSAVGGQTQSAYVIDGLDPNDSSGGHSVSSPILPEIHLEKAANKIEHIGIVFGLCGWSIYWIRTILNRNRDRWLTYQPIRTCCTLHNKTNNRACFLRRYSSDLRNLRFRRTNDKVCP